MLRTLLTEAYSLLHVNLELLFLFEVEVKQRYKWWLMVHLVRGVEYFRVCFMNADVRRWDYLTAR
jgi:hypothetical protein